MSCRALSWSSRYPVALRLLNLLQCALRPLALGHVMGDVGHDLSAVVGHGAHADLHVGQGAVLPPVLPLAEKASPCRSNSRDSASVKRYPEFKNARKYSTFSGSEGGSSFLRRAPTSSSTRS